MIYGKKPRPVKSADVFNHSVNLGGWRNGSTDFVNCSSSDGEIKSCSA